MNERIENRDYVIAIDQSGSMSERDCDGKSRWEHCKESVKALLNKVDEIDPDGVDLYFYNQNFVKFENITSTKLDDTFKKMSPIGGTSFAPVLNDIFGGHFSKQARPTTVLFITDGEASDSHATKKAIVGAANKLEANDELAISFIQVGKCKHAQKFLVSLDDDLEDEGAKFDIVDTVPMDKITNLEEVLLNAIID